jgi:intraflagellar transport protein 140
MNRALSLCLAADAHDALEEIADSVGPGADPAVLERCGELLSDGGHWGRAATFFALAHKIPRALKLCEDRLVKLPQRVIDALAHPATDAETAKQIAGLCEQQSAFITAAQIHIRIGDHLSALRNLIQAGDVDKVNRFATLLKRRDAFIIAGDYIAGMAPREKDPLFATCVQFYQRGGEYGKIAEFLAKCAQVEIDEDQNYEKALELLKRAHQTMAKAELTRDRDAMVESCLQRIRSIEMYIEATKCVQSDPLRMQSICNELLHTAGIEECLRIEDVYLLLVQYYVSQENFVQAHRILENMAMNGVDLKFFMEVESIKRIYRAAGRAYVDPGDAAGSEEPVLETIPDDIPEIFEDDF